MTYRVFYHKTRIFKIRENLLNNVAKGRINYGGDIDINWNSEIFKISDLFYLGHLNIGDDGSFAMRVENNFYNYVNFLNYEYGINPHNVVNAFDNRNLGRIFKK